jgi:hypothetical protein
VLKSKKWLRQNPAHSHTGRGKDFAPASSEFRKILHRDSTVTSQSEKQVTSQSRKQSGGLIKTRQDVTKNSIKTGTIQVNKEKIAIEPVSKREEEEISNRIFAQVAETAEGREIMKKLRLRLP